MSAAAINLCSFAMARLIRVRLTLTAGSICHSANDAGTQLFPPVYL
jgi:hypothetical protein